MPGKAAYERQNWTPHHWLELKKRILDYRADAMLTENTPVMVLLDRIMLDMSVIEVMDIGKVMHGYKTRPENQKYDPQKKKRKGKKCPSSTLTSTSRPKT